MKAYRLCAPWHKPWDAAGAVRRGGRWNSPGVAILYAASSLSLACLEILVHVRDVENIPELSYSELTIPDTNVGPWRNAPERTKAILESEVLSRELGDNWIGRLYLDEIFFAAMQVPSAVIPQEWNYLIDPGASTFGSIHWSVQQPFRIDPRLIDANLR
jgi:RES domain-containing protein